MNRSFSFLLMLGLALQSCATAPSRSANDRPAAIPLPQLVDPAIKCEHKVAPKPISTPHPPYPADLRRERVVGRVVVMAVITTSGDLRDVRVIKSDDSRLSAVTLSVVQSWRYSPATCDGAPVEAYLSTDAVFALP